MTRGVTVVLAWGALGLAACGSSEATDGSQTPAPSATSGGSANGGNGSGGSGAVAQGGSATAGKGGAASTAGTPGSAGGAGTPGAAGASGSAPLRDACRAYVAAYCEKQSECNGTGPSFTAQCILAADRCPDLLMSPGTGHSLQNLLDCVEPLRTANCSDWRREIQPACVTPGLRAKGEPCVYRSQCQSTSCREGEVDSTCGVCRGLAAPGGPCNDYDTVCPPGQTCADEVCVDIPVTPDPTPSPPINLQAEGEACFSETCLPELHCVMGTGATEGVCQKLPAAGSACAERTSGRRCASTAYCGVQGCAALPVAGEACVSTDPYAPPCAADLTCSATGCTPLGALGESCLPNLLGLAQVTCQSDLVCACLDDECRMGACQSLAKEGATCGTNRVCEHGTVCETGVCRATDALTTQAICDRRQ